MDKIERIRFLQSEIDNIKNIIEFLEKDLILIEKKISDFPEDYNYKRKYNIEKNSLLRLTTYQKYLKMNGELNILRILVKLENNIELNRKDYINLKNFYSAHDLVIKPIYESLLYEIMYKDIDLKTDEKDLLSRVYCGENNGKIR